MSDDDNPTPDSTPDSPIQGASSAGESAGDDAADRPPATRRIQPVPPEFERAAGAEMSPETETSVGSDAQESALDEQVVQPVPPDVDVADEEPKADRAVPTQRVGGAGADQPTAEVEIDSESTPEPTSSPASLYDVPWQPAEEPIPEWITEQAAEQPRPASGGGYPPAGATAMAPAARATAGPVNQGVPPAGPVGRSGGGRAAPAHHAAADRPRRAGIIAASAVALAIVLVGGGVIGLLAMRGGGSAGEPGATTISDAVDETILPPTSPPPSAGPTDTPAPPTAAPTNPPTTPPPAPTSPPTAPPGDTPNTVPGDLGLAQPMRRPACDGQYIVITANAVTPGEYERQVAEAQQRFVGAAYLKTDQTCPSLRPFDDLGNAIYSIYYGPFPTLADACGIQAQVGGDSYIKILDQATPFTKIWDCS